MYERKREREMSSVELRPQAKPKAKPSGKVSQYNVTMHDDKAATTTEAEAAAPWLTAPASMRE